MDEGTLKLTIEGFSSYKQGIDTLTDTVNKLNSEVERSANILSSFETQLSSTFKNLTKISNITLKSDNLTTFASGIKTLVTSVNTLDLDPGKAETFRSFAASLNVLRLAFEGFQTSSPSLKIMEAQLPVIGQIFEKFSTEVIPKLNTLSDNSSIDQFKNVITSLNSLGRMNASKVDLNSILNSISLSPQTFIQAQFFKNVAGTLAQGLASFDLIKAPTNLREISGFVQELPKIFSYLENLSFGNYLDVLTHILAIIPPLRLLMMGIGQLNSIPSNLGELTASLRTLFEFIEDLGVFGDRIGTFNVSGFASLKAVLQVIPTLWGIALGLKPFSGINAEAILAAGQALPTIYGFLENLSKAAEVKGTFTAAFSMFTQVLSLIPTLWALAKGLAQFNNVKILEGDKFGELALGLKRLSEAAVILQDVLRLNVFASLGSVGNVKKVFTALAEGAASVSAAKINKENFKEIADGLESISKAVDAFKNVENTDISRAFAKIKNFISSDNASITVGVAQAIGEALLAGLKANEKEFKTLAKLLGSSFAEGFKEALGIASPSRVFMQIGEDVTAGLSSGLGGMAKLALNVAGSFVDAFKSAFGSIQSTFATMGQNLTNAGKNMFASGRDLAITGGVVTYLQSQQIGMAAEFDQTLKQIEVFGGLQGKALGDAENKILQFSAETIFDPQQSAIAFLDLQKAGLSASEATNTLSQVGNLAAAGQIDLATSTRGVVSAMQVYGLEIKDTTHITDSFTRAANLSTADVSELIQGMGNVGPIAAQFGLSFDETVAILAKFNDAGIRGAEAGTNLKSMLTNMTRPTEKLQKVYNELGVSLSDSAGNFKGIDQIFSDLRHSLYDTKTVTTQIVSGMSNENKGLMEQAEKQYGKTSQKIAAYEAGLITLSDKQRDKLYDERNRASQVMQNITGDVKVVGTIQKEITRSQAENFKALQELAGTYGQAGLSVLLSDDENAISDFIKQMEGVPSAAETSASMMDTFKGALDSLRGSIDTLMIKALRPLMNYVLKPLIEVLIEVVNGFANLPAPILAVVAGFGFFTAIVTTLVGVGMMLIGSVLIPLGMAFTAVSTILSAVAFVLFNPIGLIAGFLAVTAAAIAFTAIIAIVVTGVTAIGAAIAIFVSEAQKSEALKNSINALVTAFTELLDTGKAAFNGIIDFLGIFKDDLKGTSKSGKDAADGFQPIVDILNSITDKIKSVTQGFKDIADFAGILRDVNNTNGGTVTEQTDAQKRLDAANAEVKRLQSQAGPAVAQTVNETMQLGQGQDLAQIARQYNMSVKDLLALNPQIETYTKTLEDGSKRIIPIVKTGQDIIVGTRTEMTQSSADMTAAIEEQAKAQAEVNRLSENERMAREKMELAGLHYEDAQQRQMSALQSRIEKFGETNLGQKVFGALGLEKADILGVAAIIGNFEKMFSTLGDQARTFKDTVAGIFTGQNSIGGAITSGMKAVHTATKIFENLTGINISDSFQAVLALGDSSDLVNYVLNQLEELFKSVLQKLTPKIANLFAGAFSTLFSVLTYPLKAGLEKLGIDTAFIDVVKNKLSNAIKVISTELLRILSGDQSLSAAIENIFGKLGMNSLLNFVKGLIQIIRGAGTIIQDFVQKLFGESKGDGVSRFKFLFDAFEKYVKPVVEFVSKNVTAFLNKISDYVKAFSSLTDLEAAQKIKTDLKVVLASIGEFILSLYNKIKPLLDFIRPVIEEVGKGLTQFLDILVDYSDDFFRLLYALAYPFISLVITLKIIFLSLADVISNNLGPTLLVVVAILAYNLPTVLSVLSTGFSLLLPILGFVATWFILIPAFVYGLMGALRGLAEVVASFGDILLGVFQGDFDLLAKGLARFATGVIAAVAGFIGNIAGALAKLLDLAGLDKFANSVRNVANAFKFFSSEKGIAQLSESLTRGLSAFFDAMGMIPTLIKAAFGNMSLFEIGTALIQGVLDGMKYVFITMPSKLIKMIYDNLIAPVLEFLGIASPSKLFMEIGTQIVMGLINGIAGLLGSLPSLLVNGLTAAVNAISGLASGAGSFLGNLFGDPVATITNLASSITNALNLLPTLIGLPSLSSIGSSLLSSIFSIFGVDGAEQSDLAAYATTVKDQIVAQLNTAFSLLLSGDFSGAASSIMNAFKMAFTAITNIDDTLGISSTIKGWITSGLTSLSTLVTSADFGTVKDTILNGIKDALGLGGRALGALGGAAESAADSLGIGSWLQGLISGGISTLSTIIDTMDFSSIPNKIITALKTALSSILSLDDQLGISDAIKSMISVGIATISDLTTIDFSGIPTKIFDAIKGAISSLVALDDQLGISDKIKEFISSGLAKLGLDLPTLDLTSVTDGIKNIFSSISFDMPELPDIATLTTWFTTLKDFLQNTVIDGLGSIIGEAGKVISDMGKVISDVGNAVGGVLGIGGGDKEKKTATQAVDNTAMLSGISISAVLPEESKVALDSMGINIAQVIGESLMGPEAQALISASLTSLLSMSATLMGENTSSLGVAVASQIATGLNTDEAKLSLSFGLAALLLAIPTMLGDLQATLGVSSPALALFGLNQPLQLTELLPLIMNNIILPLQMAFALSVPLLATSGSGIGNTVKSNILSSFGNIALWVMTNIQIPFVNAIRAMSGALAGAMNDAIPDQAPVNIKVWMPTGWEDFASQVQIPDPFQNATGRAFGGSIIPGKPYQVLEQSKNVPFELFQTGNQTHMIANQPGIMSSPLRDAGLMGGNVYVTQSDQINVTVTGTNLSGEEIAQAVRQGIREERQNNPKLLELKRYGR